MRKKTRHYPLIYARYVLPLTVNIAIIIISFLPVIRFTLDSDERQTMSLAKLIQNTWDNSRLYLFSSQTQQTNDGVLFYKSAFSLLIILTALFIAGTLLNIFAAISCKAYFFDGNSKLRNIYTSIVPNRVIMLIFSLSLLPIAFFPDILVYLYRHLLLYNVSVEYSFLSTGIMALILFAALVTVTLISRKKEEQFNLNIFKYKKNNTSEECSDKSKNSTDVSTARHYSFNNSASTADKLKELLGDSEKEKSPDTESVDK